jgi:hypothetical protein
VVGIVVVWMLSLSAIECSSGPRTRLCARSRSARGVRQRVGFHGDRAQSRSPRRDARKLLHDLVDVAWPAFIAD